MDEVRFLAERVGWQGELLLNEPEYFFACLICGKKDQDFVLGHRRCAKYTQGHDVSTANERNHGF
jgi:uncharacterized membrane protein YiaA